MTRFRQDSRGSAPCTDRCAPVAVASPAREAVLSGEEQAAIRIRLAHPAHIVLALFFLVASGLTVAVIEYTVPNLDPALEHPNILSAALHHQLSRKKPAHDEIVCVSTNGQQDPPHIVFDSLSAGTLPLAAQSECQYGEHKSGLTPRYISFAPVVWLPKNRVHVGAQYFGQRTLVLDYKRGRWQVVGSLGQPS